MYPEMFDSKVVFDIKPFTLWWVNMRLGRQVKLGLDLSSRHLPSVRPCEDSSALQTTTNDYQQHKYIDFFFNL